MKDAQITLRLPKELARALSRTAKARGVPRSQLVREAVQKYVAEPGEPTREELWQRVQPFIGSVHGDQEAMMADPVARQMWEHNFRE
jgi:Arc/MetJ-type ribon-helix-helix transcriptional regulator